MVTLVILSLMVLPVVTVHYLNPLTSFKAVGVLMMFTLLFTGAIGLLTTAKRRELFAAGAAYFTILAIFNGNFNGGTDYT